MTIGVGILYKEAIGLWRLARAGPETAAWQ